MKIKVSKLTFYLKFIAGLLCFAVFIRLFIGEPCTVPSASMQPTIIEGDRLWIDKLTYGARLPRRFADIPILNIFTWIKPLREADLRNDWGENRLKGRRLPQINDVVVFESPEYPNPLLVKRISKIKTVGDTLPVNTDNYEMMENLIRKEGDNIIRRVGKIFINGKADSVYRVKQSCYFMTGDKTENSHDSRSFGYVPYSSVVGKVNIVIYSFDNHKIVLTNIRMNRFFKKIN
ncbi:MAG: signal peptidase I [Tannerella sp.]|jgi:signal peptidase I|nr:signal peptidase I [Tannerella sp.]